MFLLSLSIFMSSGLLQQAMVAERENRVLEVLLVSGGAVDAAGRQGARAGGGGTDPGRRLPGVLVSARPLALAMIDIPLGTVAAAAACSLSAT